jgi:hypothetical protein
MNECEWMSSPRNSPNEWMNEWMRGTGWKNLADDVGEGSFSNTLKATKRKKKIERKRKI